MERGKTRDLVPLWSLAGLVGGCTFFGMYSGGIGHALQDMGTFLSGNTLNLPIGGTIDLFLSELFGFLTILFMVNLLLSIGLAQFVTKTKDHAVAQLLAQMRGGFHTGAFLLWAAAEEVIFRWFFLDVLAKETHATTGAPFYFIVVLSVILFGVAHAANFNSGMPTPLVLLPQMLSGVIFVVVFLQWGLLGSTFVHFCFNATLLSTAKKQEIRVPPVKPVVCWVLLPQREQLNFKTDLPDQLALVLGYISLQLASQIPRSKPCTLEPRNVLH